jgi:zinc protease
MKRLCATALGTALLALPLPARAAVFSPESFTLENGLQVVVVTNHRAPVVTQMVWYKCGSADEEPGKSGIAHFLEHLMFKGTDDVAPGEFSKIIARNGGNDNAFTSWDYTAFYQSVASDRLELVMRMEADRMSDLGLSDEVVYPERDVIVEERHQRTDNDPGARLGESAGYALYVNHGYGIPIIGWEREMQELTREDAEVWYHRWYAPNNAILVVSGDVEPGEVRELAETYFGPIPARDVPERRRPAIPPLAADTLVTMADPEVRQPYTQMRWLAPTARTEGAEHIYALQVMAEIMGGGTTSRLYRDLVVERQIASSAGFWYDPDRMDWSSAGAYGVPRGEESLEELETALREEINRVLADGVTRNEVSDAVTRLQAGAVFARDSLSGPANTLGAALAMGGSIADVEEWPDRIGAVTPEQVQAAAKFVFENRRSVTSRLLPAQTGAETDGAPMSEPAAEEVMP